MAEKIGRSQNGASNFIRLQSVRTAGCTYKATALRTVLFAFTLIKTSSYGYEGIFSRYTVRRFCSYKGCVLQLFFLGLLNFDIFFCCFTKAISFDLELFSFFGVLFHIQFTFSLKICCFFHSVLTEETTRPINLTSYSLIPTTQILSYWFNFIFLFFCLPRIFQKDHIIQFFGYDTGSRKR